VGDHSRFLFISKVVKGGIGLSVKELGFFFLLFFSVFEEQAKVWEGYSLNSEVVNERNHIMCWGFGIVIS